MKGWGGDGLRVSSEWRRMKIKVKVVHRLFFHLVITHFIGLIESVKRGTCQTGAQMALKLK